MKKLISIIVLTVLSGCFFDDEPEKDPVYFKVEFDEDYSDRENFVHYCQLEGYCGSIIDDRDGEVYEWTMIKNRRWFKRSLNFPTPNSYCSRGDCAKYGRLYNWIEAMDLGDKYLTNYYSLSSEGAQGLCPEGWRVPNKDDWVTLSSMVYLFSRFIEDDDVFLFNPDTLLYSGIEEANVEILSFSKFPLAWHSLYDEENFEYKGYADYAEFGLIAGFIGDSNDYLTLITSNENPENPEEYMVIEARPYGQSGNGYYVPQLKNHDIERDLGILRCVQTLEEEQAISIWKTGLEKEFGIKLKADKDYEK